MSSVLQLIISSSAGQSSGGESASPNKIKPAWMAVVLSGSLAILAMIATGAAVCGFLELLESVNYGYPCTDTTYLRCRSNSVLVS